MPLLEEVPQSAPVRRSRLAWIWAAIATLLVVALAVPAFRYFRGLKPLEAMLFHVTVPRMLNKYGIAISPDGRLIAYVASSSGTSSLFVQEIGSVTPTQIEGTDGAFCPVWSPDGFRFGFSSQRKGNADIFEKKASVGGEEIPIAASATAEWMEDWSKDGKYIAAVFGQGMSTDLYAIPLFGDRKPIPIVQSPSAQDEPHFSFNGKWLAYNSNESGTWQVYVVPFPAADPARPISSSGGVQPRWREDGKELYYLALDGKMMAVDIRGNARIEPGIPHALFETQLDVDPTNDQYAVTPDGQRFLLLKPLVEAASTPITVVLNWTALLKK